MDHLQQIFLSLGAPSEETGNMSIPWAKQAFQMFVTQNSSEKEEEQKTENGN